MKRYLFISLLMCVCLLTSCSKDNGNSNNSPNPTVEPTVKPTIEPTVEPTEQSTKEPDYYELDVEGKNTDALGAIIIVDDSAYEYYSFNKEASDKYVDAINKVANLCPTSTKIYDMIVPNSMDILLPESLRKELNSSDQKKAIDYMYYNLNEKIIKIPVFTKLKEHASEYIFFRTDHHWTALGAYYAYEKFCEVSGLTPVPLKKFKKHEFSDYIGSFYANSGMKPQLKKNPDIIVAYEPRENTDFMFRDKKGDEYKWDIITDVSTWKTSTKYSTFIGGDNPYSKIINKDNKEGKTCLVIKESYANAFVPFLVPHYGTIHIIDYRYYKGNLIEFIKTNKIDDVLFLNTVSMTGNIERVKSLEDNIK